MSVGITVFEGVQVPLELTLTREGVGGVTGQSPTVALRDATTTNNYLDWGDNTFKLAGWTTKYGPMTEVERGHYHRLLDLNLVSAIASGSLLLAEYHVDDGSGTVGSAHDLIRVTTPTSSVWDHDISTDSDLSLAGGMVNLLRKGLTNRLELEAGSPGYLRLYNDDGSLLLTWDERNAGGGGIVLSTDSPAKRAKAT